jgi:tripartite-type tricarboxylate transporter receptor subunit TctC
MENDTTMFGFVMGPGVEKNIIEKYNMILTKVLQAPNVKESLELQGILVSDPLSESSDFTKFAHEERIRLIQQLKAMPPQ